jgi:predicted secreted protein
MMLLARVTPLFLTCLLVTALPVQAASSATYTLTEKDSGRTVTMRVGEKLRLDLSSPASGGYTTLTPTYDAKILTWWSRQDLPPEKRPTPLLGDFGRLEFIWEAKAPGETAVTVNIARPWEQDQPPEQYVKIRVLVGQKNSR